MKPPNHEISGLKTPFDEEMKRIEDEQEFSGPLSQEKKLRYQELGYMKEGYIRALRDMGVVNPKALVHSVNRLIDAYDGDLTRNPWLLRAEIAKVKVQVIER